MNAAEIIILAMALATDAMIVSFSYGMLLKRNKIINSLKLSVSFGLFQCIMPIIGWYISGLFYNQLFPYSKIVVFIIFTGLGIKFIKSAAEEKEDIKSDCISIMCLLSLSIATSIDAMGAGVTLKFINAAYLRISAAVGIITFIMSMIGYWSAELIRKIPSRNIEIAGGILLIYLGIKNLI